ncbi:hypothetical protein D3C77_719910 [compost metagenome]
MQRRIAIHNARPHQGLMLPGPGFVTLIIGKGFDGADQHPGSTGRTQTGIHLIENAGRGAGAEQMHHPLCQTQIELASIDATIAIRHYVWWTIQQEHQI